MKKLWVCLVSMLATAAGVAPVAAQTTNPGYELEEVVVTAELREVNLQKVSTSIQVTSGEELRKEGKKRIDEIMQGAVGIQMQDSQNGVSFFVRGVDAGGTGAGAVVSTPVLVDGVAQSRSEAVRGGTLDLARAEVMRGPQSTTLGANSLSGAVSLVSNKPVFEYQASTNLDIGNYHNMTMEGVMNVPLADNQAVRIAFTNQKRDGYYSNGAGNSDLSTARIKYRWQPTDSLDITATAQHQNIGGNGVSQLTLLTYGKYMPWKTGDAFSVGSTLNQFSICQVSATNTTLVTGTAGPAGNCANRGNTGGTFGVVRPQDSLVMIGAVPSNLTTASVIAAQTCFPGDPTCVGKIQNTFGGVPEFLGVPTTYIPINDGTNFRTRANAWDDGSQALAWSNNPQRNTNIESGSIEFNWTTDVGTVTFLPSYQSSHFVSLEPYRNYQAMGTDNRQRTKIADLRVNSNSGDQLQWRVGLYYSDDRQNQNQSFINAPGVGMGMVAADIPLNDPGQCNLAVDPTTGLPVPVTVGMTAGDAGLTASGTLYTLATTSPCYNYTITPEVNRISKAAYFNAEYSALDTLRLNGGARFIDQTGKQTSIGIVNGNQYGPYDTCTGISPFLCTGTQSTTNGQPRALDNVQTTIRTGSRWTHTTFRSGFEWDVLPEAMVYAVYSTGFNPGSLDGMTGAVNPAVTLEQTTVGLKSQAFDNRLQFNAESFMTTYHNRPVDGSVLAYIGGADATTCNVGMGQTQSQYATYGTGFCVGLGNAIVKNFNSTGIDIDTTWLISPVDRLNVTAEYMAAKYDEAPQFSKVSGAGMGAGCATTNAAFASYGLSSAGAPNVYGADGKISPAYITWVVGCTGSAIPLTVAAAQEIAGIFDTQAAGFIGTTLQNAPKFSSTLTYSHNFLLANGSRVTPRISGIYKTKYWSMGAGGPGNSGLNVVIKAADDPTNPYYLAWQQSYATWDASLAWDKADGKFTVNGYVKNLTNEVVMSGYTYSNISIGAPRTWGATFTANF